MIVAGTSLSSYLLEIEPTLGERQSYVLNAFKEMGEFTNSELSVYLHWSINRVTPRVFELRKKGLLRRSLTRSCKVTGRSATVWVLNINPKQAVLNF